MHKYMYMYFACTIYATMFRHEIQMETEKETAETKERE